MESEKRLIDANALMLELSNKAYYSASIFKTLARVIQKAPSVDAVEVVHGKWEMGVDEGDYDYGTCSVCGYNEYNAFCCLLPHNYCPSCGAKMDGDGYDGS